MALSNNPFMGPSFPIGAIPQSVLSGSGASNRTQVSTSFLPTSGGTTGSGTTTSTADVMAYVHQLINGAKDVDVSNDITGAMDAATTAAEGNLARAREGLDYATAHVRASGMETDAYLRAAMYNTLNQYAPGWQTMMAATTGAAQNVASFAQNFLTQVYPMMSANLQTTGNIASQQANQMLQGRVPGDVLAQVRRASAERAVAGLGMSGDMSAGSSARNMQARDLGLTSLNVMQAGESMAGTANSIYQQLGNTAQLGGSLLGAAASVGATGAQAIAALTPESTASTWMSSIGNLSGILANAGAVDPTAVLQAHTQASSERTNLDWVRRLTLANYALGSAGLAAGNMAGGSTLGRI